MVLVDSTALMLIFHPDALPPVDPNTEKRVPHAKERIEYLIRTISEDRTRVLIPTPVLSELLICSGAKRDEIIREVTSSSVFEVAPFDLKSAIELALLVDGNGNSAKPRGQTETRAKLKFDRQIIAIAKANNIKVIYSDDGGLATVARANGLTVHTIVDLPLPPASAQEDWVRTGSQPDAG